jgi:hypothetical protein
MEQGVVELVEVAEGYKFKLTKLANVGAGV